MSNDIESLDRSLQVFKSSICEINYLQSIAERSFNNTIINLASEEQASQSLVHDSSFSHLTNCFIKLYPSGQLHLLGTNDFSRTDILEITRKVKNRHYQLLLVQAFEAFEDHLEIANSLLQKYEVFNRTKIDSKKSNFCIKFLKRLHSLTPQLDRVIEIGHEQNPKLLDKGCFLFLIALIEQLRHQIVHTQGIIDTKEEFIDKCFSKVGLSRNCKSEAKYLDFVEGCFGTGIYQGLICLTEEYDGHHKYDRLGYLIEELASYTILINGYIKKLIQETPHPLG